MTDGYRIFQLTGARAAVPAPDAALRPALFAPVADLARLRYDYPLVLVDDGAEPGGAMPLSAVVDALLAEVAPRGPAGERTRRAVLRLERELRTRVLAGSTGRLGERWAEAARELTARGGGPLREELDRARAALRVDGALVDCDGALPACLVSHLWRAAQERRARELEERVGALAQRLADLVRADRLRSREGRGAEALRASVGAGHRDTFDFGLMARLLAAPSGTSALSETRRARIARTLAALDGARAFGRAALDGFVFTSVREALDAARRAAEGMARLAAAIAAAELELRGRYVEAMHDAYVAGIDATALTAEDRALFPQPLVIVDGSRGEAEARASLVEGLASGLPLKIVFATDDAFGAGARLASAAMGLGDAFVVQASAARLASVGDVVRRAIEHRGPALVAVFAPSAARHDAAPGYLVAAAATESRAFPTFAYDPSAGAGWKERFALLDDPQPDRTWPEHELRYVDGALRRRAERLAFTPADLAILDDRARADLAPAAPGATDLVPLARWLEDGAGGVPFVYGLDAAARLVRLVVDRRLADAARRTAEAWTRLRELDALKRERLAGTETEAAAEPEPAPTTAPPPIAEEVRDSGQPYIETARCASCNECTNLNPRMFAYNENKQAYIKDITAGTYRDLVEAAEACQVAIIHPGEPRDPNEPGLDELRARAAAFA